MQYRSPLYTTEQIFIVAHDQIEDIFHHLQTLCEALQPETWRIRAVLGETRRRWGSEVVVSRHADGIHRKSKDPA